MIEISVEDEGIGIQESDYEKVFQPFVQIDESISRKHGGVGLGLALVKRFVELHGGKVWVKASPGEAVYSHSGSQKSPEQN